MKLLKITFLFLCVTGIAQTKVGTIDVDFVISNMPELLGAQEVVDTYGKSLDADLQKKMAAYEAEIEKYKVGEAGFTVNQKKDMQNAILEMEKDIQKFQQNGNKLILLKQEESLKPLYEKVGIALEKVAKAGGYTQVFTRNDQVVYVDNRFDLTLAVLKDMGVEVKPEE